MLLFALRVRVVNKVYYHDIALIIVTFINETLVVLVGVISVESYHQYNINTRAILCESIAAPDEKFNATFSSIIIKMTH